MKQVLYAALLALGGSVAAQATPLTFTATVGGVAVGPNLGYLTFDDGVMPPELSYGLGPNAQLVTGSASGLYAAPYLSNGNGAVFGESPANGPDATRYLTIGAGGSATFTFAAPQTYFGLLWGSVDSYNHLTFYDAAGVSIGSLGGGAVAAVANGDQGVAGSYYVNINSSLAFAKIVATSDSYAFELDDVAYAGAASRDRAVPEPGTTALLAGALLTIGLVRQRRKLVGQRNCESASG
jgi:hypothetical protein